MGDWSWFKQALTAILAQALSRPQADSGLKDFLGNLESIVRIAAVIIGGIWTYRAFIRSSGYQPRAALTHQISHLTLDDKNYLLVVDVFLENLGEVSIELKKTQTWVQQLVPPPADVQSRLTNGGYITEDGENEAGWPPVDRVHEQQLDETKYVIDPRERDQFRHNFAVNMDVKTVQVYTYLEPKSGGIGWKLKSTYDMDSTDAGGADAPPQPDGEEKMAQATKQSPLEKKQPSDPHPVKREPPPKPPEKR